MAFLDTEHLFMLPIKWLHIHEVTDFNVKITQMFYNAYCMPKYFCDEKYFNSWDPKIHGPHNYLHSF